MPIAVSLDTVISKIAAPLNKPQELNKGWRRIPEDSNGLQIQSINVQLFLSREFQAYLIFLHYTLDKKKKKPKSFYCFVRTAEQSVTCLSI